MTETNRFRTVARALAAHMTDTYALLAAADSVIDADPYPSPEPVAVPHDLLVFAALGNDDVMSFVVKGEKINAIKALRALWPNTPIGSGIDLPAAKDAVKDPRVTALAETVLADLAGAEPEPLVPEGDPWAAPLVPQGNPWVTAPMYDETGTRGCSCGFAEYGAPGHDGGPDEEPEPEDDDNDFNNDPPWMEYQDRDEPPF